MDQSEMVQTIGALEAGGLSATILVLLATDAEGAMIHRFWKKLRRRIRNWNVDPTRADRNAVIQRIVTAAAAETHGTKTDSSVRREPGLSPQAAAPMGADEPEPIAGELVGARAHEIWLRNGRPPGTAAADWLAAESELRVERQAPS